MRGFGRVTVGRRMRHVQYGGVSATEGGSCAKPGASSVLPGLPDRLSSLSARLHMPRAPTNSQAALYRRGQRARRLRPDLCVEWLRSRAPGILHLALDSHRTYASGTTGANTALSGRHGGLDHPAPPGRWQATKLVVIGWLKR